MTTETLEEPVKVASGSEPCDCGYHVRHNNGGNYHAIEKVYLYKDRFFLLSTTTREQFPNDCTKLIDYGDGQLELVQDEHNEWGDDFFWWEINEAHIEEIKKEDIPKLLKEWEERGWYVYNAYENFSFPT